MYSTVHLCPAMRWIGRNLLFAAVLINDKDR